MTIMGGEALGKGTQCSLQYSKSQVAHHRSENSTIRRTTSSTFASPDA
ncbi:MAG: hypothetical protein QOK10_1599, partial [Pseudonocardiales bacterium]|nr:hypothetical protein [Pseudonocardiales bacterium]